MLPKICPFCEHVIDHCEVVVCSKHQELAERQRAMAALAKTSGAVPSVPRGFTPKHGDLAALLDAEIAIQDDRDRPRLPDERAYIEAGSWPLRWQRSLGLLRRLHESNLFSLPPSPPALLERWAKILASWHNADPGRELQPASEDEWTGLDEADRDDFRRFVRAFWMEIQGILYEPLTVGIALMDPRFANSTHVIETVLSDGKNNLTRQWRLQKGALEFRMSFDPAKGWIGTWSSLNSSPGAWAFHYHQDLMQPARLVPVEVSGDA